MQGLKPTPGATAAPSTEQAEPEPTIDAEVLDLCYGPGGFYLLDSDDVDALIAARQARTPSSTAPPTGDAPPTTAPVPGKAA